MTRTVKRTAGSPSPFSGAIREAAARRGLSTRKLAAAADLGESAVRNFLKGRADLTLTSADRLAAALNLRVTEAPARKPAAAKPPPAPAGDVAPVEHADHVEHVESEPSP